VLGRDDRNAVNEILAATDRYYKRTGIAYLAAFMVLAFVYPMVVGSELAKSSIFAVIVLTGFSGVISYFFQGKYNVLLLAEGKNYITSNLGIVIYVLTSAAKIILLLNGFDVVALQAMYCFFNVVKMLYIEWYIRRHYRWLEPCEEEDLLNCMDLYSVVDIQGYDLVTEEEQQRLEASLYEQVSESGFAEEAAVLLAELVTETEQFREDLKLQEVHTS